MALTQRDEYEVMYSANKVPPRIWLKHAGSYIGLSSSSKPTDRRCLQIPRA